MTAGDRRSRERIAAYSLHAKYDSKDITRAARAAFMARFEAEVDPLGMPSIGKATVDVATPRSSRVDCGDMPSLCSGILARRGLPTRGQSIKRRRNHARHAGRPRVSCKSCSLNDQKTLGTRSNSW